MSSPLYQQFQPQNNFLGLLQKFKSDPMSVLAQKYNIPQGMNNPNDIIQHLLNSGQINQEQINNVMRMYNNPQIRNMFK